MHGLADDSDEVGTWLSTQLHLLCRQQYCGGGGGGGRPSSQNIGGGGGGGQQCPPVLPLFILHCSFEESSLNVTPSANFYKI